MDEIVQLQEANRAIYSRMREMQSKDDWTAEDQANWDAANEDYTRNKAKMDRLQQLEDFRAELDRPANGAPFGLEPAGNARQRTNDRQPSGQPTFAERMVALQGWLRSVDPEKYPLSDGHRAAMQRCGMSAGSKEVDFRLPTTHEIRAYRRMCAMNRLRRANILPVQYRADDLATAAGDGGETIPEGFVANWEFALLAYGGVRQVADVIRTATGNDLPWPTTDDTGNTGELVTEAGASSVQGTTTSAMTLGAYKYGSKIIKVSSELMQDGAFDLAAELGRLMGIRIGRITNTHFTTGTGSGQPNGIVTAAADSGVTAASSTTFTGDELIDVLHAVDPAYRVPGSTGWMMNDTTVAVLRKIKINSEVNNYAWQPGLSAGDPDRLLNWPITINQDMAVPATTAKSVVFGQLDKYKIRDVGTLRLRRADELYLANDQIGFVAFMRTDGDLLDAGTNPVVWANHT